MAIHYVNNIVKPVHEICRAFASILTIKPSNLRIVEAILFMPDKNLVMLAFFVFWRGAFVPHH